MKKILFLVVFLGITNSVFSQFYYESKVLNLFFVGFDTEWQLKQKADLSELNVYSDNMNGHEVKRIILNDYMYKNKSCKVVLFLVDDVLYGVQYYPLRDKPFEKYVKLLNGKYDKTTSWKNDSGEVEWSNNSLLILQKLTGDYTDYFVHYNKGMLIKYPQYKNF
jgi:hypothetical protein